jgi:uncharacterized lipoprotein YddW (UPF0748 family)
MRRFSRFVWCSGAVALVLSLLAAAPSAQPRTDEVRGLWVLRTSLTSRQSIAAMVRAARDAGFNTLLVQVRGRGEAYYRSAIEPRASDIEAPEADFDPLRTTLDLAHRAGLRVHAWVNVDLVSSAVTLPRSRAHIALRHPEWLMVPAPLAASLRALDARSPAYLGALARWTRSAELVEGLYLSPIPHASQEYTASVVAELASSYALDGIHLDYVRYPNENFDYSSAALAAFRWSALSGRTASERLRLDDAAKKDATAWAKALPEEWSDFRRRRLTDLVVRLRGVVRAARPNAIFSAAVVPDAYDARNERFQDWGAWAELGYLDAVCPMAYTPDAAEFAAQVARARTILGDRPLWPGIGAYRLAASETVDRIRVSRRAGVEGILVFSYDSVASHAKSTGYFAELRAILTEAAPVGGTR